MNYSELTYDELKDEAVRIAEENGHKFLEFIESSPYGYKAKTWGHSSCIYCKAELHFDSFPSKGKPYVSGKSLDDKCISIGKTIDENGINVCTWSNCGKCGKKLNPKRIGEMKTGFHSKCKDSYEGTVIFDIFDGKVHVSMKSEE